MSSITVTARKDEHPHMRNMNMFRDLSAVADLIELCFADTMDNDGQRYISDMRRASRDDSFLNWASHMTETATLPLTGFVWEENGRIVGNASLIPFRDRGKRIYLIANIAVHPEYRRRGIARALTQRAMQYGWDKKAPALWLHVRNDNPGAIELYQQLGFTEIASRTTWFAKTDQPTLKLGSDIQIVARDPRFWPQQHDWLRRIHPDALGWYRSFNFNSLRPGLMNWLYMLFVDMNIKQWAAVRGDKLLATLSWTPNMGRSESLYAATIPAPGGGSAVPLDEANPEIKEHAAALTRLLMHGRRALSNQARLTLEYPGGEMRDAFIEAGFIERRTLLWMRVESATKNSQDK